MVPHPTEAGKVIKKGALDSHVTALGLWKGTKIEALQHKRATAWEAAQDNANKALSSRELTARLIVEQLYYLAVGHTAIHELPGLLEHIERTVSIIEARCNEAPNVSSCIPVDMESWKHSAKVHRGEFVRPVDQPLL